MVIWQKTLMPKALFLDRDGIVNVEKNYVHQIKDFEFISEVFEMIKLFQKYGFLIFIITNQAGIARGYYSEAQYQELTTWMLDQFRLKKISISKVYHCPHHPQDDCECRKPKPGMILQAQKDFNLDLKESYLIGDKESDIEAGISAGIIHNLLIGENHPFQNHKQLLKHLNEVVSLKLS